MVIEELMKLFNKNTYQIIHLKNKQLAKPDILASSSLSPSLTTAVQGN